jgi:GTP-binding protein HflX
VWTDGSVEDAENSMAELAALAETAGSEVLDAIYQRRDKPDPATFIGRGKVEGIAEIVRSTGADTVICDGELAPSQLRNLEDRIKVKVVDRTALILDIFAQHAKSKEGQAQVELAQLNYLKQRLRGWGGNLSRQVGGRAAGGVGIGGRGPGETKIETDRRRINTKIARLRRELAHMKGTRDTKRQERRRRHIPSVAIAGYTNAGKSSLLNRLTGAGVLVEDALFATLDPTTRRTTTTDGRVYTMSDTVGFVRHLPHQLVEAFRSTLEEVADSDLVLHVVDGSHPDPEGQIAAVREVFAEIGADKVPEIIVVNKADAADPLVLARLQQREPHAVVVSAKTGEGIDEVLALVEADLPRPGVAFEALVPYARGDLLDRLHQHGEIESIEHTGDGTVVRGRAHADLAGELAAYPV